MDDRSLRVRDGHALYELIDRLERAWNAGRGDVLATLFREDVDYTSWNGIYFHGREAVLQNHRRIFGANYLEGTLALEIVNIRFMTESCAAVHVAARLRLTETNPPATVESAALFLMTKQHNLWRCEVFHNTLVPGTKTGPVGGMGMVAPA
jgi:uncharacterized protein (TIGR02246 family)